jgi:hypothetical protein
MSELFYKLGDETVFLAQMSNGRAALFVALTEAASQIYKAPTPVIIRYDGAYHVHAERMCALVEEVYSRPINMLYVWAMYAAGMYEVFKGERSIWLWDGHQAPNKLTNEVVELQPVHYSGSPEVIPGNRRIGPHWYMQNISGKSN